VCIAGEGFAARGAEKIALRPNLTVDIPPGADRNLENSGTETLCLLAVAIGNHADEDEMP
jgi:mannose-6-phosphate isomerase-like protein (cupin superfamily)